MKFLSGRTHLLSTTLEKSKQRNRIFNSLAKNPMKVETKDQKTKRRKIQKLKWWKYSVSQGSNGPFLIIKSVVWIRMNPGSWLVEHPRDWKTGFYVSIYLGFKKIRTHNFISKLTVSGMQLVLSELQSVTELSSILIEIHQNFWEFTFIAKFWFCSKKK